MSGPGVPSKEIPIPRARGSPVGCPPSLCASRRPESTSSNASASPVHLRIKCIALSLSASLGFHLLRRGKPEHAARYYVRSNRRFCRIRRTASSRKLLERYMVLFDSRRKWFNHRWGFSDENYTTDFSGGWPGAVCIDELCGTQPEAASWSRGRLGGPSLSRQLWPKRNPYLQPQLRATSF